MALLAAASFLPVCFLPFFFSKSSQTTAEEENISERSLAEKASDTSLPVHRGSVEETPQTLTSVSHLFFPFCRSEGSGGVNPLIGCHLPAALTALATNIRGAASRALASVNHPAPNTLAQLGATN